MTNPDPAASPRIPADIEWAGPSRRARLVAAALAVLLAALTGVLVSLAWKGVTPPRSSRQSVEVQLIATPAPAAAVVRAPGPAAPSAPR